MKSDDFVVHVDASGNQLVAAVFWNIWLQLHLDKQEIVGGKIVDAPDHPKILLNISLTRVAPL